MLTAAARKRVARQRRRLTERGDAGGGEHRHDLGIDIEKLERQPREQLRELPYIAHGFRLR